MATKLRLRMQRKPRNISRTRWPSARGRSNERWFKQGGPVNIMDVRAAEDYAEGHIPGAVNLPKDQWDKAKVMKGAPPQKQDQRAVLLFTCLPLGGDCRGDICEQGVPGDGTRGRLALVAGRRI